MTSTSVVLISQREYEFQTAERAQSTEGITRTAEMARSYTTVQSCSERHKCSSSFKYRITYGSLTLTFAALAQSTVWRTFLHEAAVPLAAGRVL
eukprot:2808563-Prymnesium_polylepis.2